jgi:hypothetical protein
VVKQKSHCEEIFGTGQGNPNLQWDYCKQGFLVFFQFFNMRNLANYSQKIVKLTQEKTKVFHLSSFWLKKRQKIVGNEALIVRTNLLRNVENLSCAPHAR